MLAAYAAGNLSGQQAAQRDFSPFLVHFTSFTAMAPLRSAVTEKRTGAEVQALFDEADARSWEVMKLIAGSRELRVHSPAERHLVPACVCLSECNLPGLVSHSERYGRFGLALAKQDVYRAGGRPCLYMGESEYGVIAELGRGQPATTPRGRLYGLSNLYVPPHSTNRVQDYTHEREWRVFDVIDLRRVAPAALFAPARFAAELCSLFPGLPVVPLDLLFLWGA